MDAYIINILKFGSIIVGIIILGILEALYPLLSFRHKVRHDAANIGLWIINITIMNIIYGLFLIGVYQILQDKVTGLLEIVSLPPLATFIVALLLIDLWMYCIHIINHKVPFLWKFHKVHHADSRINRTTGLRFHTGEMLVTIVLRVAITPFLGIELWHFLAYEMILLPFLLVQHGNIRITELIDRPFRPIIATNRMHHVHHSQKEYNTNFGSILSIWDRLFGSYQEPKNIEKIKYGLANNMLRQESLGTLLVMPFEKRKK